MYDYMMSLQKYFSLPLECEELEQQIKVQCCQLREHLNQQDRRTLLRLIDLEIELRDKAALNSFFSGFRLATGIHQELMSYPPHGFDAEEEKQAMAQRQAAAQAAQQAAERQRIEVKQAGPEQRQDMSRYRTEKTDISGNNDPEERAPQQPKQEPVRAEKRVGRNDLCPCGSGKKYKNCHGQGL